MYKWIKLERHCSSFKRKIDAKWLHKETIDCLISVYVPKVSWTWINIQYFNIVICSFHWKIVILFIIWPDDLCWLVLLRRDEGSAYDFQHKTDAENNQYIIPHLYCIVGFILQSTFDIIMMFPNSTIEPEFFFFLVQQDIFSAFTL